jgi:hypothetical protein
MSEMRSSKVNDPNTWDTGVSEALPFKFASNEDAKKAAEFYNRGLGQGERAVALLRKFIAAESPLARPHLEDCRKEARAFMKELDARSTPPGN